MRCLQHKFMHHGLILNCASNYVYTVCDWYCSKIKGMSEEGGTKKHERKSEKGRGIEKIDNSKNIKWFLIKIVLWVISWIFYWHRVVVVLFPFHLHDNRYLCIRIRNWRQSRLMTGKWEKLNVFIVLHIQVHQITSYISQRIKT